MVGRLILFREYLHQDLMPFGIDNNHNLHYYHGLSKFHSTWGILFDTIQSAQDTYVVWVRCFNAELLEGIRVSRG